MTKVNKLVPPSDFERKFLQEQLDMFYIGKGTNHLSVALALSRGLNANIRLLNKDGELVHSFVEDGRGQCYDASGCCDEAEVKKKFCNEADWPPEHIDTDGFVSHFEHTFVVHTLLESHATKVGLILETLYPNWPWEKPPSSRVEKYLEGLAELSRQHGLWLVTPSAGLRPQVGFAHEEEALGYTAALTEVGSGLLLSRVYRRD